MSDKAFFDWFPFAFDPDCDGMVLKAWNAATERATALERERCAALVELRTGLLAMHSIQRLVMVAAADAIRQGGESD